MRAYCPHSPMVGTGWLEGWRLTFAGEDVHRLGGRGHHDRRVAGRPGLRGALRRAPLGRAAARRGRGGDRRHVPKLHVRVATLDGEVTAWVYVFDGYEGGLPTAWYLSEIANAAEKAGAPDDYVAELRSRPTGTATA